MSAMEGEVIFNQKDSDDDKDDEEKKQRPIIKSATDLQRLKLEKLMKNPEKPVNIPELPKDRDHLSSVPSFVRNVMGSSAGAGSGEFHVYRHLRRKEYARQKAIQYKSYQEELDDEHAAKMEENRRKAEDKTAKKRAKRQKKKQKMREHRKKPRTDVTEKDSEDEGSSDEDEESNKDASEGCKNGDDDSSDVDKSKKDDAVEDNSEHEPKSEKEAECPPPDTGKVEEVKEANISEGLDENKE